MCEKKSEVKFGIIAGGSFQNERGFFQNLEGPFRTRSNSERVLSEFRALRVLSKPDLASPFRIWVGPFRISVLSKSDLASPFRIWVDPFRIWSVLSETVWVATGGYRSDCSSFQNCSLFQTADFGRLGKSFQTARPFRTVAWRAELDRDKAPWRGDLASVASDSVSL